MSIAPDEFERSRAAVAISCLRWLQCTGPGVGLSTDPAAPRPFEECLRSDPPIVSGIHDPSAAADPPHPLWDRWLDG